MATLWLMVAVLTLASLPSSSSAQHVIVVVQETQNPLVATSDFSAWSHSSTTTYKIVNTDGGIYTLLNTLCTEYKASGMVAILDASRPTTSVYTKLFANSKDITYVRLQQQLGYTKTSLASTNMLSISHPQLQLVRALRALFTTERIEGAAIIYDKEFGFESQAHDFLYNVFTYHQFFEISSSTISTVSTILKTCRNRELLYVVLATSPTLTDAIFKQMESNTDVQKYHFVVLRKKTTAAICATCKKSHTLVTLEIESPSGTPTCSKTGSEQAVFGVCSADFVASSLTAYKSSGSYVALRSGSIGNCSDTTNTTAVSFANYIKTRTMSTTFGSYSQTDGYFSLTSNVVMKQGTTLPSSTLKTVAKWTSSTNTVTRSGISATTPIIPDTSQVFRVITLHSPPFVFKTKTANNVTWSGLCIDIIDNIAQLEGFQIEYMEPPDLKFGGFTANGSWTGMVNELVHDRADIIAAPFSIMEERATVVDFTSAFYEPVGITILLRRPFASQSLFRFVQVYDGQVWGFILLALIVVSLLIGLADAFGPLGSMRHPEKETLVPQPRQFTFLESLWFCIISMTPQGGGDLPVGFSGRMLAVSWWLFGFLIISTYRSNLAVFLTVSRLDASISSLDDLAKQSDVKYSAIKDTASQEYFHRMKDIEDRFYRIWKDLSLESNYKPQERAKLAVWEYPMVERFTTIWESMSAAKFPDTLEDAEKRVSEGDYALLNDATMNKYAEQNDCNLKSIGEEFSQKAYAFAVQKGSYLKETISQRILQLNNNRFLEKRRVYWWEKNKKSCPKETNLNQGIGLDSIGGVFVFIPIGLVLGLLILLLENIYYKYMQKKRQKQQEAENQVKTIVVNSGNADKRQRNGGDNPVFTID